MDMWYNINDFDKKMKVEEKKFKIDPSKKSRWQCLHKEFSAIKEDQLSQLAAELAKLQDKANAATVPEEKAKFE